MSTFEENSPFPSAQWTVPDAMGHMDAGLGRHCVLEGEITWALTGCCLDCALSLSQIVQFNLKEMK